LDRWTTSAFRMMKAANSWLGREETSGNLRKETLLLVSNNSDRENECRKGSSRERRDPVRCTPGAFGDGMALRHKRGLLVAARRLILGSSQKEKKALWHFSGGAGVKSVLSFHGDKKFGSLSKNRSSAGGGGGGDCRNTRKTVKRGDFFPGGHGKVSFEDGTFVGGLSRGRDEGIVASRILRKKKKWHGRDGGKGGGNCGGPL